MGESKNIVLIIGNGFDLDLGLKTSYKDFWRSVFCPKTYPAPIIKHLNEKWDKDLDSVRWYDLENELFQYYTIIENNGINDVISSSEKRFLKIVKPELWQYGTYSNYRNEARSLCEKGYLSMDINTSMISIPYHEDMLHSCVWRDKKALSLIKEGLCRYLLSLGRSNSRDKAVATYVFYSICKARETNSIVDIFSFNYTPLPYSWGDKNKDLMHYVHGSCSSGNIIIGTQDYSGYNKDYDFLQKSFDKYYYPPNVVSALLKAHEIIFYGHSIGENDKQYFKAFFKQQTDYSNINGKEISFFTLDDNSELEIKRSIQSMTDSNLSALFTMNHIHFFKTSSIAENTMEFRSFLSRMVADEQDIEDTMSRLGI